MYAEFLNFHCAKSRLETSQGYTYAIFVHLIPLNVACTF